jgi:hypothetical protein
VSAEELKEAVSKYSLAEARPREESAAGRLA